MNEYEHWSTLDMSASTESPVFEEASKPPYIDADILAAALGSCANIWGGDENPLPLYEARDRHEFLSKSSDMQEEDLEANSHQNLYSGDGDIIFNNSSDHDRGPDPKSSNSLDCSPAFSGVSPRCTYLLDPSEDWSTTKHSTINNLVTPADTFTYDPISFDQYSNHGEANVSYDNYAGLLSHSEASKGADYFGAEIVTHVTVESPFNADEYPSDNVKLQPEKAIDQIRQTSKKIVLDDGDFWPSNSRELWSSASSLENISLDDYGPWHSFQLQEVKSECVNEISRQKFPAPPKSALSLKAKRPSVKMIDCSASNPISPVPILFPPMIRIPSPHVASKEKSPLLFPIESKPNILPVIKSQSPSIVQKGLDIHANEVVRKFSTTEAPCKPSSRPAPNADAHSLDPPCLEVSSKAPHTFPLLSANIAPLQPVRRGGAPSRHCR